MESIGIMHFSLTYINGLILSSRKYIYQRTL